MITILILSNTCLAQLSRLIPPQWVIDAIERADEINDLSVCLINSKRLIDAGGVPESCEGVEYIPTPATLLHNQLNKVITSIESVQIDEISVSELGSLSPNDSNINSIKIESQIKVISSEMQKYEKSKSIEQYLLKFSKKAEQGQKAIKKLERDFERYGLIGTTTIIASNWSAIMRTSELVTKMTQVSKDKLDEIKEKNSSSRVLLNSRMDELVTAINSERNSISERKSQERQKLEEQKESLEKKGRELQNLAANKDQIKKDIDEKRAKIERLNNELTSLQKQIDSTQIRINSLKRQNRNFKEDIDDESKKICDAPGKHKVTDLTCTRQVSINSRKRIEEWEQQRSNNTSRIEELDIQISELKNDTAIKTKNRSETQQALNESEKLLKDLEKEYKARWEKRKNETEKYLRDRKILDQLSKSDATYNRFYSDIVRLGINLRMSELY